MSQGESPVPRRKAGDLLVVNIGQLLTLAGPSRPRSGTAMTDMGIVTDGAVLIEDGLVKAVGPKDKVSREARGIERLDAKGRLVMPGFVDPHTHAAFAGSREGELADKLAGKSYAQIAIEGGGIKRTVRETRAASRARISEETGGRLKRMLSHGTTTAEVKSGYGLNLEGELKLLEVIADAGRHLPIRVIPTFLGAHAVPEERNDDPEGYVEEVCGQMLPSVASRGLARFCDVFVEEGFFNAEQGRQILTAGQERGLTPKVHADELTSCGGAELAAEVGAVSADHLLHSSPQGLRALIEAGTVAVLLPGTCFSTSGLPYADARRAIDMGLPVALGTDLSPNSWIESMQFVISLACYQMRMKPEEAIEAATINAAWAVGMGEQVGSLDGGKRGDLILLDVRDYREIPYRVASNLVREVVVDGHVVQKRQA